MTNSMAFEENPYIIGRPIYEPQYFFGREDIFQFLQENLRQRVRVILLHGQRRIGKSSVLAQIPNFIKLDQFVFIPLSLEGKSQKSLNAVLRELAIDIKDYLTHELGISESKISLPSKQEFRDNYEIFSECFLPSIYEFLENKSLVLLIDEFDVLGDSFEESAANHFFPYLQSILHQHHRLFIVPFVGRQLIVAATQIQTQVSMQLARRGMTMATARYGATRAAFAFVGSALWAWFLADLGWRAIATNYGRVIPTIFALAQIRLTRSDCFEPV